MLSEVYRDDCVSLKCVYDWFKRFQEGRDSIEDADRSGRPTSVRTLENVEKVKQLLSHDRRLTIRMISDELYLNRETVRLILTQDLGKRKICSRLVPHFLTTEQMQTRVEACRDLIKTADENPDFLNCIVTGDESWCLKYDPETKRQSSEWRSPGSPRQKKVRSEKSRIKTMLIAFFDSHGIIHKEFLPEGSTMNANTYVEILKRLLRRIRRVRPQYAEQGSWCLLHDNARPHTALVVQQMLAEKGVVSLAHPPYSPDLAPADFFLFPKLKLSLKGKRFSDIPDIQSNVIQELNDIRRDDFARSFQELYQRSQKCINLNGDYFEGR